MEKSIRLLMLLAGNRTNSREVFTFLPDYKPVWTLDIKVIYL